MRVRCLLFLLPFIIVNLPDVSRSQSTCPGIHVVVQNIRNTKGSVGCALFDSPAGFPREYLRYANRVAVFKIQGAQARCDFEYIPIGNYAIAVIHDENMNGKFDTNKIGVPTEGFGFSNVAQGKLAAPPFSAASFYFDGGNYDLTISLQY